MGFWAAIGPDQRVLHYLAVNISYPSRKEMMTPRLNQRSAQTPRTRLPPVAKGVVPPPWLKGSKGKASVPVRLKGGTPPSCT